MKSKVSNPILKLYASKYTQIIYFQIVKLKKIFFLDNLMLQFIDELAINIC